MTKDKKKNTWIKPRHRRWWNFANGLLRPIIDHKYNMEIVPFEDNKGQYLILCNHQTPFDQFYLSRMFKGNIYFVCTEDLLSNKTVGGIIKHTIEPIPIQKGTMDLGTIKACARVAKEGGSIIVYPEGNRTYSGKTGHIKPAVAKLAKFLKLPIALVRQEGGFGVEPRWSNNIRKGKAKIYVSKVLSFDEYKPLTDDQLYQLICQELHVDDSVGGGTFKHKRRAEYIERAMYVCPHCGLSHFVSDKHTFSCTKCGTTVEFGEDLQLKPIKGEWPFATIGEWYDYQCDFVNGLALDQIDNTPLYQDEISLSQVIVGKRKKPICKKATLSMYADRIEIVSKKQHLVFTYQDITGMAVMGRNKLNFHCDGIYQVKGKKRFNALKYMNIFYRYKNIQEADNGTFLGI